MAEEPVTYQINPFFQFSCVLEKAVLALISETAGTYRRIHDDDLPAPAPAPAMERKLFLKEETPASPAFPSCLLNNFSVYKQHPRIFDLTPTASVASSIEAPKSPAWSSSRGLNRSRQSVRGSEAHPAQQTDVAMPTLVEFCGLGCQDKLCKGADRGEGVEKIGPSMKAICCLRVVGQFSMSLPNLRTFGSAADRSGGPLCGNNHPS
ncbi:uncharacterized protein K444DRAFT_627990 [Hyaloscypha bicolor E]|uniref:Uncharacterized protein n=1 Tax=Hyaloscypha bicolor E TaxID=1095630 RepID=A0A2J6TG12_9HELO|nr:uncharacterized protein K444DRAFT_627990 [Hyaloscypha bicolor E]PMD61952.1 hypothetical protein K444DRAFT_627990 [Hyaloscypha bicolor E]